MTTFDLTVIGGSASGLCAAIQAARCNKNMAVAVLERMPRAGKKILATGNGRCNLSNTGAVVHPYHNAAFAKNALQKYDTDKTLAFFESIGLLTVTDCEGRVYPMSNTAASVLDALRFEAARLNIKILCNTAVKNAVKCADGGFRLGCIQTMDLPEGAKSSGSISTDYMTEKLIIATGGSAAPVHGSDGSGFGLLKQLGHKVTPLFPALVQLTTDTAYPQQLKGIRVSAAITVEINGKAESCSCGEILFTEYGLSGIAAMDVSRTVSQYFSQGKKGGCYALLDLAPSLTNDDITRFLKNTLSINPRLPAANLLSGILPGRVGQAVCKESGIHHLSAETGSLTGAQLNAVAGTVKAFRIAVQGTCGFDRAQVTAGGADISGFNPQTLESKKIKGLYACGEVLDVDGGCGGFNLQWAWSSGLLAGELG